MAIRFTDLIGKIRRGQPAAAPLERLSRPSPRPQAPPPPPAPKAPPRPIEPVAAAEVPKAEILTAAAPESPGLAWDLYRSLEQELSEILQALSRGEKQDARSLSGVIVTITNQIQRDDRPFLDIVWSPSPPQYLLPHLVNACILSVELGLGAKLPKAKLNELALCGCLYDFGMVRVLHAVGKPGPLSEKEWVEVKKHPIWSGEILGQMDNLYESVLRVAEQHHERLDGSGYPKGLKGEAIDPLSRMIALTDSLEAMTHDRPFRKRLLPSQALTSILEKDELRYDASFLKALIERLGMFPVGTWVELNSGEIGRVVARNEASPLRPVVDLLLGADRKLLKEAKHVDLGEVHTLYVKAPFDERTLPPEAAATRGTP